MNAMFKDRKEADAQLARALDDQRGKDVVILAIPRGGRQKPSLFNRPVILVDDGIAMGSTAQAAIMCCRKAGAKHITMAAPVASRDARTALMKVADEVVALLVPPYFRAVADYYLDWHDVSDAEALAILAETPQIFRQPV